MSTADTVERIFQLCKSKGVMISVCESLTGGLISSLLIEKDGASAAVYEGITAYSNESKIRRLFVSEETLKEHGAVSEEVAAQMAEGLYKSGAVGLTLSTTGIAGPGGGSEKKPVGLVFFGLCDGKCTKTYKYVFSGNRNDIRNKTAEQALAFIERGLKDL
ncbi:MAG: CinA family protein [Clostridiales bacterium]|jgi:nicotinamide-nucleotide amidase|nr:CinA family protein [Clostridiales bacterium]